MPGIAGIISAAPPQRCRRLVLSMIRAMQHPPLPPLETGTLLRQKHALMSAGSRIPGRSPRRNRATTNRQGVQLAFAGECLSQDGIGSGGSKPAISAVYRARGMELIPHLERPVQRAADRPEVSRGVAFQRPIWRQAGLPVRGGGRAVLRERSEGIVACGPGIARARRRECRGIPRLRQYRCGANPLPRRAPFAGGLALGLPPGALPATWTILRSGETPDARRPPDGGVHGGVHRHFSHDHAMLYAACRGGRRVDHGRARHADDPVVLAAQALPMSYTYAGPMGETLDTISAGGSPSCAV